MESLTKRSRLTIRKQALMLNCCVSTNSRKRAWEVWLFPIREGW